MSVPYQLSQGMLLMSAPASLPPTSAEQAHNSTRQRVFEDMHHRPPMVMHALSHHAQNSSSFSTCHDCLLVTRQPSAR